MNLKDLTDVLIKPTSFLLAVIRASLIKVKLLLMNQYIKLQLDIPQLSTQHYSI